MALSIGELTGFLDLDAGPFEAGIGKAMESLSGNKFKMAAGAAGVLAGTALAAGLLGAMDMDTATRKMNASLGLTGPEAERAGKAAGNLYSSGFGESMEDATAATESVISSIKGMRTASEGDLEAMAKAMGTVATIVETDVARAAQVAGQMITSGLAKDGTEAADLLTATLQKVPQAVRGDILDATDEYGPFFTQLGISGETAMTMLADSSEKGMFGIDKTGDALKEFTIRSTDMSKSTVGAYDAMGLSSKDMTNDLLAGGDRAETAFAKIIMGLDGIKDPGQQAQAAISLFGTPLEDLGTGEIPKFLDGLANMDGGLGDVSGAAAKAGDEINGGPQAALKEFTRTIQTSLMDAVAGLIPVMQPFLETLIQFAPIVAPLAIALGAFAAAIWIINAAMGAWTVVQGLLNVTLLGFPLVWIVVAVIALIAAIWLIVANWEQISAWLGAAFAAFGAWWTTFWGTIGAFIASVWQGFLTTISTAWAAITAWIMGAVAGFLGWWSAVWNGILAVVRTIWQVLGVVISTAWEIIQTIIATALSILIALFTGQWGKIGAIFLSAWNKISGFVQAGAAKIWGIIAPWIARIASFMSNGWNSIKSTAINIWNGIIGFFKSIPGKVLAGLQAIANLHVQMGRWILSVKDAAVDKFMSLVAWVKGVPGRIVSALGSLGSLLSGAGRQILQGFLDGLKAGFEAVKNFVGGIGSWIADHKGPKRYDLGLLVPAGGWIMDGLGTGIEKSMPGLASTLGDVSWMIANGIDPEVTGGGQYAFGANGNPGAASSAPVTAVLSAEDRALLRAVADRDVALSVDGREIARANIKGRKELRLPA